MTLSSIEQKALAMSPREFFSGYHRGAEFHRLPHTTRREIIADKFGLTWEEFAKLPGTTQVAMMLEMEGNDYLSGVEQGISAAQKDARLNSIRSYFAGFQGATRLGTLAILAAGIGTAYAFRRPIIQAAKKKVAA